MRKSVIALACVCLAALALTADNSQFLSRVKNARTVYVTSYSGPELSPSLIPSDRTAIGNVEAALQKSGHYVVVYRPQDADMIVTVESRPSEDVLAVYDRQSWRNGVYLWRAMGKNGLSSPGVPLVQQLESALGNTNPKPV